MTEVFAVKTQSQLDQIDHLLIEYGQIYSDIWQIGLNTALRVSDLLQITMESVSKLDAHNPQLHIKESKTGKYRWVPLNGLALRIVNRRVADNPQHAYLFQQRIPRRNEQPAPITSRSVLRVLSAVGSRVTPAIKLGTHSMRKTRGYMMHADGVPLAVISEMLNHETPAVTMRYVGLTKESVDNTYSKYVIGSSAAKQAAGVP